MCILIHCDLRFELWSVYFHNLLLSCLPNLVVIFSCKCISHRFTSQKRKKIYAAERLTQGRSSICLTPNLHSNAKLKIWLWECYLACQATGVPEFQVLFLPTCRGYELLRLLAWLCGLEVPELHHDVSGKQKPVWHLPGSQTLVLQMSRGGGG